MSQSVGDKDRRRNRQVCKIDLTMCLQSAALHSQEDAAIAAQVGKEMWGNLQSILAMLAGQGCSPHVHDMVHQIAVHFANEQSQSVALERRMSSILSREKEAQQQLQQQLRGSLQVYFWTCLACGFFVSVHVCVYVWRVCWGHAHDTCLYERSNSTAHLSSNFSAFSVIHRSVCRGFLLADMAYDILTLRRNRSCYISFQNENKQVGTYPTCQLPWLNGYPGKAHLNCQRHLLIMLDIYNKGPWYARQRAV